MKVEIIVDGKPLCSPIYLMAGDKVTYTADGKSAWVTTLEKQLKEAKEEVARWAASDGGKWQTLLKISACSSLKEAHRLARSHVGEPYYGEGDDW